MTQHRILSGVLFLCLNALTCIAQNTAPNQWTWIGGSNTVTYPNGQPGVYGTLGTAAAGNIPGARDSAATWTDSSGNFWLFGGEGVDANGNFGQLNDLWKFQPSTQEWTWMGGSSTLPAVCAGSTTVACGQPGVYGTMGSAAAANIPGGRSVASYRIDSSGNFWLFAGYGFDASQNLGDLNDLWEFSLATKQWTWMGGSSTIGSSGGQPGVYGTLGSAAVANVPGSRDSAASWIDKSGQLWIYGGEGLDSQGNYGQLNDLWEFDPTNQEWTWIGGSSTLPAACATSATNGLCGWPTLYGALGVSAPGINPGSRVAAVGWTDSNDNLWLFGGLGSLFWASFDFSEIDQYDLWEFNPSTNQWAWMGGNSSLICGGSTSTPWCGQDGIYGTEGSPAIANTPPSRSNASTWSDSKGNLWLFAGAQALTTSSSGTDLCNDVWVFEASNEWAWMNGAAQFGGYSCSFTPGTYGVLGKPAAANTPSGRLGTASWTDSNGNLWAFGGYGWNNGTVVDLNDLWIYKPVAPAPKPSFELIASPNPINIGAQGPGTSTITTGTTVISILVADGFSSPVTLTATPATVNLVTAVTGSFSPPTITGAGSSTLTMSVTGAAVLIAGPIPLTITGTSGGPSQSIQVIVDVTVLGQLKAPTFSPPPGAYPTPQTVSISDSDLTEYQSQFMYYTADGTTPTQISPVYVNPITVASTTTLKAIAISVFSDQSAVTSATYTIAPAAPTPIFVPGGGNYPSAESVTLTDSAPGATIYYTTDGSAPTTNSTVYNGPIAVSSDETLEAMATANGYSQSAVSTATYTIAAATPIFAPSGGTYSSVQSVTISDSIPWATIYYTTDGSTPTTNSTIYAGLITVSSSETLQAIAAASDYSGSAVATAAYIIDLPSFSITGTAVSVTPGAPAGNTSTLSFTPSNGFTGVISLSCAITPQAASDPATCSVPASVTISGTTAQTIALTVNTTGPNGALNRTGRFVEPWMGGTALACIFAVSIPARRRKWWSVLGMLVLLFCVVGGAPGCGGSSNGGGGGGNPGTTPGTYTITVTGTSGNITQRGTVSLTVQ